MQRDFDGWKRLKGDFMAILITGVNDLARFELFRNKGIIISKRLLKRSFYVFARTNQLCKSKN